MSQEPSKGYLIVASKKKTFLLSAFNLIDSIKYHYPEAKIALFTEPEWMKEDYPWDDVDYLFECGDHYREKLYGIANSPFDQTFYIDADCVVEHSDISKVFDHLDGYDMAFVELTKEQGHHFVELYWNDDKDKLKHCGGVCLYDNRNPLVRSFMKDWYEIFLKQDSGHWWPDPTIPKSLARWDQFTLWWLIYREPKYKDLRIKIFEDNYRWNYFSSFGFNKDGTCKIDVKDPVIIHYSAWMDKDGNRGVLSL